MAHDPAGRGTGLIEALQSADGDIQGTETFPRAVTGQSCWMDLSTLDILIQVLKTSSDMVVVFLSPSHTPLSILNCWLNAAAIGQNQLIAAA